MNPRVGWVSSVVFALLTSVSVCLAQDSPAPAVVLDSTAAKTTTPALVAQVGDQPMFGGLGGQLGFGDFPSGGVGQGNAPSAGDYSRYAQPRMSFAAKLRYTFAPSWRWQVSPGFMWASYSKRSNPAPFKDLNFPTDTTKDNYLSLMLPISTQVQWVARGHALVWHVGLGPGLYRVWVENHRKVVRDPVTLRLHRGMYFGATAEIGVEHFFKALPTVSFESTLDLNYVAAKRDKQFPSGFNATVTAVGLRVGANYYFNLRPAPKKTDSLPVLPK